MPLLVNQQLIPIMTQPKGIYLEQIGYKRCKGIAITSLHCLSTSKNKNLKQILKSATNVAFKFLWASKFVFS